MLSRHGCAPISKEVKVSHQDCAETVATTKTTDNLLSWLKSKDPITTSVSVTVKRPPPQNIFEWGCPVMVIQISP